MKVTDSFIAVRYDLSLGCMYCRVGEYELSLPMSLPIFGVGPKPYKCLVKPRILEELGPSFKWLNYTQNVVFDNHDQTRYRVSFEKDFISTGRFRLAAMDNSNREVDRRCLKPASEAAVRSKLDNMIANPKVMAGDNIRGIIMYFEVMRGTYLLKFPETLDIKSKLIEHGKVIALAWIGVKETNSEFSLPVHLISPYYDARRTKIKGRRPEN